MVDASDQRPAPSASGTLANRPLVHLLVYARNRRLSGRLHLHAADGRRGMFELWRGRITDAQTLPPIAYFGSVAYELDYIDTPTLDATLLEIAKTKRLHGEVLVERGDITGEQRDQVLAEQACRKIHHLFSFPADSTFEFYDSRPASVEPRLTLDPLEPAWRGLRDGAALSSLQDVLARYAATPLRLTSEAPISTGSFNADERALCEKLAVRSMTLAQMRATSRLPGTRVDLLAYLLVIAKCVEPAPASVPSMPAASAAPPSIPPTAPPRTPASQPRMPSAATRTIPRTQVSLAPSDLTPQRNPSEPNTMSSVSTPNAPATNSGEVRVSLSFRVPSVPAPASAPPRAAANVTPVFGPTDLGAAGIAHRAQSVDSEDFFEALGLPEGATADAARAAYFRLARLWHPDRLPGDLEPFRAEVEKVFGHMTRASATLTDSDSRRTYLATHDQNAAATTIASKPHSDVIHEIEAAIGKREFVAAQQSAGHLIALDADDAEAQALSAWAMTQAGEAAEDVLRTALPLLDKAVHTDTYCESAHFYRGVVHKRLGSSAAAFRDFSRVVQINPKHIAAQREIRIFEMRARKGSGEHALDVLLAKTKKR